MAWPQATVQRIAECAFVEAQEPTIFGVAALLPRDGKLLITRRAEGILCGGAWCFPGGAIEPGERAADALVREMREEVGLEVRPLRKVAQSLVPERKVAIEWWLVEPAVPGDYVLRLNRAEVAEARWLTLDEIEMLPGLLDSNRAVLSEVRHVLP